MFGHWSASVWDSLGPKVWALLDAHGVLWTLPDVVRFADDRARVDTLNAPAGRRRALGRCRIQDALD